MTEEKGKSKTSKETKKEERLRRLSGIDLCACAGGHQLKCHGICRIVHTNPDTRVVECGEMYQINQSVVKTGGADRRNRSWRYGRQKDVKENKSDKDKRREKLERSRSLGV